MRHEQALKNVEALEHRDNLVKAYLVAKIIRELTLEEVLHAMQKAEAIAPLFHPTAWIEKGDAMREDMSVVEILVKCQRELNKLPWPVTP